jgi:glycosyltransferase involved in cell wall biosynthesis
MALISIITITYNAEQFLERTIRSIANQTLSDFEYIIIDGGSKDGTMAIAEKYKEQVSYIKSEKDKGLYDAMNKGIKAATGKYIWFINAGDEIFEREAIQKIKELEVAASPDIVYGETMIVDSVGKDLGLRSEIGPHKLPKVLDWKSFKKGMLICHQAFIVKRELAPFYIENNLSADIDWEIKCIKVAQKSMIYPGILAKYLEGGVSHQQMVKSWLDRFKVLQSHFGFFENLFNHIAIIFRADWENILRLSKYVKK